MIYQLKFKSKEDFNSSRLRYADVLEPYLIFYVVCHQLFVKLCQCLLEGRNERSFIHFVRILQCLSHVLKFHLEPFPFYFGNLESLHHYGGFDI